jgi:hypothetical protein
VLDPLADVFEGACRLRACLVEQAALGRFRVAADLLAGGAAGMARLVEAPRRARPEGARLGLPARSLRQRAAGGAWARSASTACVGCRITFREDRREQKERDDLQ